LASFGNTGPGQCAGPPIDNVDFAILKNWKTTERTKLQFRLEMFNVFNHPQFRFNGQNLGFNWSGAQPVDASGSTPNGLANITTCVAIKGGSAVGNGFGQPQLTSQIENREIQFALKLNF